MSEAKKRRRLIAKQFQHAAAEGAEESRIEGKSDDDLFFVEKEVPERRKRRLEQKARAPKVESSKQFRKALKTGAFQTKKPKTRNEEGEGFDIWGNEGTSSAQSQTIRARTARLTPAHAKAEKLHPGCSYNPQTSDHQDIVAAAVAVELRREEAKEESGKLWAQVRGQTGHAEALQEPDTDDEESDPDDERSGIELIRKRNNRALTKAEKNRRARHNKTLAQQRQEKRKKQMLSQIANASKISKELNVSTEPNKLARSSKLDEPFDLESRMGRKALSSSAQLNAPAVAAPLSDELRGSLRALKVRSSLVLEQAAAKQFAIDPQLKIKKILKPASRKGRSKTRLKVKTMPRYFTA